MCSYNIIYLLMVKNNTFINIYVPKNNTIYISIISILIVFAVILYIKPNIFIFLFHTFLGIFILFCGIFLIGKFDIKLAIGIGFIFIIIYLSSIIGVKEGFTAWPQQTIDDFLAFEKTRNPNFQYDVNIIQQQATVDEVNELLKNGKWKWSDEVKQLFMNAMMGNLLVSVDSGQSLADAQMIYNENAIKQIISLNSKEGTFLLNGVIIGHTKGLPKNINNTIQCGMDASGNTIMQKKIYNGYNGIYGNLDYSTTPINNSDIPKEISGFSFLKGECNPCVALNSPPDYSCPFSINTGNGSEVSDIWKNLWGMGLENESTSTTVSEFPLLNQLKEELNRADLNNTSTATVTVVDDTEPITTNE